MLQSLSLQHRRWELNRRFCFGSLGRSQGFTAFICQETIKNDV
jgi:hypothetical protein